MLLQAAIPSSRSRSCSETPAASAEHGDLLDIIRESCGFTDFGDVAREARRFLSLPPPEPRQAPTPARTPVPAGSPEAARRLFAMSQPIGRTLVETYLGLRGIERVHDAGALRYHPRCYYRRDDGSPAQKRPVMIAAVTDLDGRITGAHRTWLAPDGSGKAAIDTPRRAMGNLLGHAVRFGAADDVLAVGEGIETMLSLRLALPAMAMAAALSANHLAALELPPTLRRLYIARDADAAGDRALANSYRTRGGDGHRGAGPVAETERLQRRPAGLRTPRVAGGAAPPTRAAGCHTIHPRSGRQTKVRWRATLYN